MKPVNKKAEQEAATYRKKAAIARDYMIQKQYNFGNSMAEEAAVDMFIAGMNYKQSNKKNGKT